ncbi:hypothetical protein P3T21_000062 [Paraburkholderia sp. GAS334]
MSASLRDVLLKLTKPMSPEAARAYVTERHDRQTRDGVGSDRTALDAVAQKRLDTGPEVRGKPGASSGVPNVASASLSEVRNKIKAIRSQLGRHGGRRVAQKVKLRGKYRTKV